MRRLPQPVVNGVKQRALFGWLSHLCTANGPSAKAMGTHGPLDPAAPEGKPRGLKAAIAFQSKQARNPDILKGLVTLVWSKTTKLTRLLSESDVYLP